MPALSAAVPPTTQVTEIPGRFSPVFIVDKRYVGTSTTTLSVALATPGLPTLTPSASGGTLATGTTYNYRISAFNTTGETLAGGEAAANASVTGPTGSVAISWTAVSGAAGYNVYGRIAGQELFLAQVGTNAYTDTGSATPGSSANSGINSYGGTLPVRNTSGIAASTTTNSVLTWLPRVESTESALKTPLETVIELGTNYNVGEYDHLGESSGKLSVYDTGPSAISLICGKTINPTAAATTSFGFPELSTANFDMVRQFADPNGNVFASLYMDNLVLNNWTHSLKAKSTSMEEFQYDGFNALLSPGYFITKAYVVQSGDVSANNFAITSILGSNEGPVQYPAPAVGQPANYWIQRGTNYFMKIARYRPATGWVQYAEVTASPATGVSCTYNNGTKTLSFASGDLVANDVYYLTFMSYATNVTNYTTIQTLTADTADPVAVPTRLTPFTIATANIPRGQSLDIKLAMKRGRADGIGDTTGVFGPPDAPDLAVDLDVNRSDLTLMRLLQNQVGTGTDNGGTAAGDFIDPNYMVRSMLVNAVPLVATIKDLRNSAITVKTITCPTVVFSDWTDSVSNKAPITTKFTGKDRVGNLTVAYVHP